jgi:hypothetical protein
MSLAGNLRTMSLPDILQWISIGQKTGTLHLQHRSVQTRIAFREGAIFSSWSNDPRQSLGQFLLRDRRVTEEQLFKALLRQEEEGRLIGSILVSDRLLSEEDLRRTLRSKAEETIYDLFLWPEGRFEFKEGELPPDVLIHIDLMIQAVLMEGIRRVDDWERIRKIFPSVNTTFKIHGNTFGVDDDDERQVLGLVAAGKTLAQIGLETHRSEFETATLLFDLYARELLTVEQVGEEPKGDTVGIIKELLSVAYQRLQEKRYDQALRAYEEVLEVDRLNQHAKKGLITAIEMRDRDRAVKKVPLAKVPVLTMDLIELTKERFDPQEGFVISRVNGQWDVQSILKLCPMAEEDALLIFSRLLERKVIELREPGH